MKPPNIENMSNELLDAILDTYKDDKELIATILFFLYHTSDDNRLRQNIATLMEDMDKCISCNSDVLTYKFQEVHSELDNNDVETFVTKLCSHCDRDEIEQLHAKVKV